MNKNNRTQNVEVPVNNHFAHDLSHRHVTTMDFFRLQPIVCQDMVPGDKFSVDLNAIIQSAPLATQVFGNVHLDLHAFFVPNRIIYDDWDAYFLGDGRTTEQSYTLPYIRSVDFNTLFDPLDTSDTSKERRRVFGSLGYPTNTTYETLNLRLSALPARAMQQIWWDYFRDSVNLPEKSRSLYLKTSGGEISTEEREELFEPRYRTFVKDYVSTLLASPQIGDASTARVSTSLGGQQYVSGTNMSVLLFPDANNAGLYTGQSGTAASGLKNQVLQQISVSALRGATALQRYLERINVTGTRTMERLLALLGVKASAERLDMAEFIGSHSININIDGLVNNGSNKLNTSGLSSDGATNAWGIDGDTDTLGQGYLTGYGSGRGTSPKFNYTSVEHGFFIVMASIIPEFSNPNALNRQFIRGLSTPEASRLDFFTPDMDGIGYQEMLLGEVCTPTPADYKQHGSQIISQWSAFDPYQVVGYQPKYEDYRYCQDRVSGDFMEYSSSVALRNMVFTRPIPKVILDPSDVQAGLQLTTATFADRALFDNHFQITDKSLDHFIVSLYVVNDAIRPITSNQLPTELSDLANSSELDVSNGGVRL